MAQIIDLTGDSSCTKMHESTNSSRSPTAIPVSGHSKPDNVNDNSTMKLNPRAWASNLRSCLTNPNLTADLVHFEPGISKINPGLFVHGVGNIGLPVSGRDAKEIVNLCKKKATNEIEGQDGRKNHPWGLRIEDFVVRNPDWENLLLVAKTKVATGLNISINPKNLRTELRGLYIIEESQGFIKPVEPQGFVGTLAVYLPTEHQEATAVFSYNNHIKNNIDLSRCSEFESSVLAWYADATPEIYKVTTGFQCILLYDLNHNLPELPITAKAIDGKTCQLENLIREWTKAANNDIFSGPLVYMLDSHKADSQSWLSDRHRYRVSRILQRICAKFGISVFIADVEMKEEGAYHDDPEEDMEDYLERCFDRNGIERYTSPPRSRGSTPEFPEILYGEEEYQITSLRMFEDGYEIGENLDIGAGNFIESEPFQGDPVESEHDRKENLATNVYQGTALVLVPRHQLAKFLLDHDLEDADFILDGDLIDLENSPAGLEARERLVNICKFYTTLCMDYLGPRSPSVSEATWFSEDILTPLLGAFACVEMKPMDLVENCNFCHGQLGKLSINQTRVLVAIVKAVGFEEVKEKLTNGVLSIQDFTSRYHFLHQFGLQWSSSLDFQTKVDNPEAEILIWVEQQTNVALETCKLPGKHFSTIVEIYGQYGSKSLPRFVERLKKLHVIPVYHISSMVNAGLSGTISKDDAFSACRDILSTHLSQITPGVASRASEGSRVDHLAQDEDSRLKELISLICPCLLADFRPELEKAVTMVIAKVVTKNTQELETVYWPFLKDLLTRLQQFDLPFSEDPDVQRLSRTIVRPFVESQASEPPLPPLPPKNWTKDARGCGCQEICVLVDQFLQDPHAEDRFFQLPPEKKTHLERQIHHPPRLYEDDIHVSSLPNGLLLTKTFHDWKKKLSKWIEEDKIWRESRLAAAKRIEDFMPEPLLEKLLGEDVFLLWHQLRLKASAPRCPIPTIPARLSSALPASQRSAPTSSSRTEKAPLSSQSIPNKRNLPWQYEAPRLAKRPCTPSSSKDNLPPSLPSSSIQRNASEQSQSQRTKGLGEEKIANEWVASWTASRPSPQTNQPQASKRHLQVYSMWHHRGLGCQEIAGMLRDPPLQIQTVKGYICSAVASDNLPFDKVRMNELVKGMGFLHKYKGLTNRLK